MENLFFHLNGIFMQTPERNSGGPIYGTGGVSVGLCDTGKLEEDKTFELITVELVTNPVCYGAVIGNCVDIIAPPKISLIDRYNNAIKILE